MKINIIISLSLVFLFGCSVYEATYEQSPLIIDGLSSDWTTTLDSKNNNGLSYGISNDKENLYIRLNINDLDIQKKIFMAGLTIWIDTTGRKKETLGIQCPIMKESPKMRPNLMKDRSSPIQWNNNQLLEARFIGFTNLEEIHFLYNNPYKVEVSVSVDEFKSMYYEMKIPFSIIYNNYSDLLSKSISIGLETGAIKLPSPDQRSANMSSGGQRGMSGSNSGRKGGGRSGGGMGGSKGGPQNQSGFSNLSTPTKVWIKNIQLAQN